MSCAVMAQPVSAQCLGSCGISQSAAIPAPPMLYQQQVVARPMQYRGTTYQQRTFPTPFRSMLFGTGRAQHFYSPVPQQQSAAPTPITSVLPQAPIQSSAGIPARTVVPLNLQITPQIGTPQVSQPITPRYQVELVRKSRPGT
ncbi:MAG: hypothetical protein AAF745_02740 [Planctomycetota bacterium]